jgi:heptaprenyl diphosphate synthase
LNSNAEKVARFGMLTALALVLGWLDRAIPVTWFLSGAVPGIKLGLANTVLLYAVYLMDWKGCVLLMLAKVFLSGFMFGSMSAILYSLSGGALSLLGMIPLSRVKGLNIITVSMVGAVLHNVGQILAAMFVMSEVSPVILMRYLAILMVAALITGAATGILAREVINRLGHMVKKKMGN